MSKAPVEDTALALAGGFHCFIMVGLELEPTPLSSCNRLAIQSETHGQLNTFDSPAIVQLGKPTTVMQFKSIDHINSIV